MSGWRICSLIFATTIAVGAFGSGEGRHSDASTVHLKVDRKDPAFRAGFDDGYRQGANDSQALSSAYADESGPNYEQATDGYTTQYGDREAYQKLFRLGYVKGYKAGWDFNAGMYSCFGAGGGGP